MFRVHHILIIPPGEIWVVPLTRIEILRVWVELLLGLREISQKNELALQSFGQMDFQFGTCCFDGGH